MGTQAAPQAGNTVTSLASTPVTTAPSTVAEVAPQIAPTTEGTPNAITTHLDEIKAKAAAEQIAREPKKSATAPPTGPAPVEYQEPAKGANSPAYPESKLDGGVKGQAAPTPNYPGPSKTINRAEFQALLDRIDNFNNRSSQKI